MNSISLRQIIKESIQEYIREVETSGNVAAQEAKIRACDEAIALREKKLNMEGLDEAYHDMIDEAKKKNLEKEIKELQKYKKKAEKILEKMKSKAGKEDTMENEGMGEEAVIDEVAIDEMDPEAGPQLEEAKKKKASKKEKEEKEMMNESFLYMQKLAGVITESQYNEKKSLIKENKALSSEEQETLDFILGGENLEEGVSQILDKIKSVARRGMLTLGIAASLLNAVPASAKADVLTTIEMAAPELDLSTIDYSTAQAAASKDDPRVALTANLKSTNPYIINSKTYGDNPIPFTSWNYGANAGKSNATVGLSLSMEKGSDVIKISIAQVPGKSTAGYEAIVAAAKSLGGKVDQYSKSTDVSISKDKASDVANFIKANVSNLTK